MNQKTRPKQRRHKNKVSNAEWRWLKMVRARTAVIAVVLLLIGSVLAFTSIALANGKDLLRANEAGQVFVSQVSASEFPEWRGARLVGGDAYSNIEGETIAYGFDISRDGQIMGSIVVGSNLYDHQVFEAGQGGLPSLPSASEIKAIIAEDLGLMVREPIDQPVRVLYLGYAAYFAMYELDGRAVAVDIRNKSAVPAASLESHLLPPVEVAKPSPGGGGVQPLGFEYRSLPVPNRQQYNESPWENDCGPTSGAMVGEYYDQYRDYTDFLAWDADHHRLYDTMETDVFNMTLPPYAGSGFVEYAGECGYVFYYDYGPAWGDSYGGIKDQINSQQPMMILFTPPSEYCPGCWHWCTIKGYYDNDDPDDPDFIYVNDPADGYTHLVNWGLNWPWVDLTKLWPD